MQTPSYKSTDTKARCRTAMQCGMGWFPEQAGGLNRMYYDLVRHLPEAGIRVRGLVAGGDPSTTGRPTDGRRIASFARPDDSLTKRWLGARRSAREMLDDVTLVASHFALYTFPLLDLINEHPLVVHFHGPWADECDVERGGDWTRWIKRGIERAVYARAELFIVLSGAFADVLVDRYGVDRDRIRIVPGGVDMARFDTGMSRADARRRLGWPEDRPTVLAVRRLVRRMGLERLIEAVDGIRRAVPDVLCMVAGDGPLESRLRSQISEAGLEEHVRLLGFVPDDDLPIAYRAADVSIVPTEQLEGFGLICLESLASGTPVLVTPVGGLPEVVGNLSERLILESVRPSAIRTGLEDALGGRLPLPSADACRSYVREHFAWDRIAAQTSRIYEEVLA